MRKCNQHRKAMRRILTRKKKLSNRAKKEKKRLSKPGETKIHWLLNRIAKN